MPRSGGLIIPLSINGWSVGKRISGKTIKHIQTNASIPMRMYLFVKFVKIKVLTKKIKKLSENMPFESENESLSFHHEKVGLSF